MSYNDVQELRTLLLRAAKSLSSFIDPSMMHGDFSKETEAYCTVIAIITALNLKVRETKEILNLLRKNCNG